MGKVADFLSGKQVLETVDSPVNGRLEVVKDLAWGIHIKGGGLTQSGGVAKKVWETTLGKIRSTKSKIRNCLILGLGGGSIAAIVEKQWPEAKITGVDIDSIIVGLGEKYLGLDKTCVDIKIEDAKEFVEKTKEKYELICIDTYIQDEFPESLEKGQFLKKLKTILAKDGLAVFNRLYYAQKRKQAEVFHRKLIHIFRKVIPVYPEANVMYICE